MICFFIMIMTQLENGGKGMRGKQVTNTGSLYYVGNAILRTF